ncbi:ExeA family protein [Thermodesulfatator atlanticus]|uniref:ExeA family protein n=1 Tax=Thermodesulfatator atlanticus TaxID=501497 RepID=UPI0003B343C9|nr:AAA family ATPase [Thermodesulfatator atlanticus]
MTKVPDYLEIFGLKDHPFRLTPDTDYFFPSETHVKTFEIIKYGLLRGEGFISLTGEPGTGKTLLLRLLLNELPKEKEIAIILSPTLSPIDLLRAILEDLEIPFSTVDSKEQLLRRFRDYLINISHEGKTLILVIDEAQNLPSESLEELRLLSNLETEKKKLVQILLVGQPLLEEKLKRPELSQLLQRITINECLSSLSREETLDYILFRWEKAGGSNLEISYTARKLLYQHSKGIPRSINKIMDRAILFAAAKNTNKIDKEIVVDALESLKIGDFYTKYHLFLPLIFSTLLIILGIFWWLR